MFYTFTVHYSTSVDVFDVSLLAPSNARTVQTLAMPLPTVHAGSK